MPGAKKVLFICTGNICRSVMAAFLLEKLARERGLDLEVRSCGVAAQGHFTVPEPVWRELAKFGVERGAHVPQLVSRPLLAWTDVALTMEKIQRQIILDQFPEFTSKVHLFRSWAGLDDHDVEDPMGRPDSVYSRCCSEIRETIENALDRSLFSE